MKKNRAKVVGLTCAGAMLLLPGTASAETMRGGTNQPGGQVSLRTDAGGIIERAKITWEAECRYGGKVSGRTTFKAPFDRASASGFRSSGKDDPRDGMYDVTLRATIEGKARGAGYKGTFKASARYEKNGEYVTTCKTGKVKWSAQPR